MARRHRPLWLPLMTLGCAVATVSPMYTPGISAVRQDSAPMPPSGASAVTAMVAPDPAAMTWWIVTFGIASGVVLRGFRRRGRASGWIARPWAWLGLGTVVGASVLALPPSGRGVITLPNGLDGAALAVTSGLGAFWILAACLFATALIERRLALLAVGLAVAAVTVTVSLYDVANLLPPHWTALMGPAAGAGAIAATLLLTGMSLWRVERTKDRTRQRAAVARNERSTGVMTDRAGLELDETVHQRTRLAIVATLTEVDRVDFASLRDELGLTDGNLARHLQVLEQAGLVRTSKEQHGTRTRTWVAITHAGRTAYGEEIRQLRILVARADERSAQGRPVAGRAGDVTWGAMIG
jgi:DNA-binding MarR family transcriptional regulator